MSYLDFKNDDETRYVPESTIRSLLGWSQKSEDELKSLAN